MELTWKDLGKEISDVLCFLGKLPFVLKQNSDLVIFLSQRLFLVVVPEIIILVRKFVGALLFSLMWLAFRFVYDLFRDAV